MDDDPFINLEKGYKRINIFDFLLNEHALELFMIRILGLMVIIS